MEKRITQGQAKYICVGRTQVAKQKNQEPKDFTNVFADKIPDQVRDVKCIQFSSCKHQNHVCNEEFVCLVWNHNHSTCECWVMTFSKQGWAIAGLHKLFLYMTPWHLRNSDMTSGTYRYTNQIFLMLNLKKLSKYTLKNFHNLHIPLCIPTT